MLDVKLSDLLLRYGIKGTFYIPIENDEIPKVLSKNEINEISNHFEVGGHTYSHTVLTKVPLKEAFEEIKKGKGSVEDIIGKEVSAFCFPRGKYNNELVGKVKEAGFLFARTVSNFRIKNIINVEKSLMHVSLQMYPHGHIVYGISVLKGNIESLLNYTRVAKSLTNWQELSRKLFDYAYTTGGSFHLWGHSWEIERYNLWGMLEDFLKYVVSKDNIVYCTNTELWKILNGRAREKRN